MLQIFLCTWNGEGKRLVAILFLTKLQQSTGQFRLFERVSGWTTMLNRENKRILDRFLNGTFKSLSFLTSPPPIPITKRVHLMLRSSCMEGSTNSFGFLIVTTTTSRLRVNILHHGNYLLHLASSLHRQQYSTSNSISLTSSSSSSLPLNSILCGDYHLNGTEFVHQRELPPVYQKTNSEPKRERKRNKRCRKDS